MGFNSVTGRAALAARGGYATARFWRSLNWSHQKNIARLGHIAQSTKSLPKRVAKLNVACKSATGFELSLIARLHERGQLEAWLESRKDR